MHENELKSSYQEKIKNILHKYGMLLNFVRQSSLVIKFSYFTSQISNEEPIVYTVKTNNSYKINL